MSKTVKRPFLRLLLTSTLSATATHAQQSVISAEPAEVVTLDQLTVENAGERPEPQGGVTVGYLTKQTRSATKTSTPIIDTRNPSPSSRGSSFWIKIIRT